MKNKLIFLLLIVCLPIFTSCDRDNITVEEVAAALPTLVENSVPLNEIYFGEGFKPLADGTLSEEGYYFADGGEYQLFSVAEIKAATEEVFTAEYAAVLYENAFNGIEIDGATVLPKYKDGADGLLQSMSAVIYELPARVYDYESLQIVKGGKERVTISVSTEADGATTVIELIVVRTKDADGSYVYRLDSPTY